ncbi:MAG: hypothetical protein LBE91_04660 [Tannerella sp.]|jgi:hypothetical protein|nr:hypothetical protein [Tannerella sp.]
MKQITKFIYMAFAAVLALTACSPDDDHNLGDVNITAEAFTFDMTPGSDEFTYNFAFVLNVKPSNVYTVEIVFGDGKSVKSTPTGNHEYVVLAGTYTANCIVTLPDGTALIKEKVITIANDNPKALVDDTRSLQYALTGGKANTEGKGWIFKTDGYSGVGPGNATGLPSGGDRWWSFLNAATANDVMTFKPDGISTNGAYVYENNGDTHCNEKVGGEFPDGNLTGSFVTVNYTPPTDATWEIVSRDGKQYLVINKGFLGYAVFPTDLQKTEYEVMSFSPTEIIVRAPEGGNAWYYNLVPSGTVAEDPLFGLGSKTWVVDSNNDRVEEVKAALPAIASLINGHMGLGPMDGGYQQWWAAPAGDKATAFPNLYSSTYTFASNGDLTIVTGGEGYGRKACMDKGGFAPTVFQQEDALFPYDGGTYTYTRAGDQLTISGNGFLVYYAGEQTYDIVYLSETALCVRVKNTTEGQDWVFILTPEGGVTPPQPGENWVDVNSDDNLWKGVNFTNTFFTAHGDAWETLPNPTLTINGTEYSTSFPDATNLQWQNQIAFVTDNVTTVPTEKYDFRVTLNASNDIKQVTVKLTQAINSDNDAVYIFTHRVDLTAGEDIVVALTDMEGKDMDPAKLVFDFGGNPANTDVVIKDIILQKHRE